jgi:surfeit locus 1 family protein
LISVDHALGGKLVFILGYQFKPRLWLTLVTVLVIILFVKLGLWQLSRAEERDVRHMNLEYFAQQPAVTIPSVLVKLEDYQYRKVEVRGKFIADHSIFLDNKLHQGVAGYHVLTPLQLENSSMNVMVNRGWISGGGDRSKLPEVITPEDLVEISGFIVAPTIKALSLSDEQSIEKVWQNFDLDIYRDKTKLMLQPLLLLQHDNTIDDGLVRQWEKSESGSAKNIGYAFQWFSLAIATLIIYLVLNVKRKDSQ